MSSVLRRAVVTEEDVVRAVVAAEYELRIAWARRGGELISSAALVLPPNLLLLDQLPEQTSKGQPPVNALLLCGHLRVFP